MFALRHLLTALAAIVDVAIIVYMFFLLGAVVISWFAPRSYHPAARFIRGVVEPLLKRVRRAMPFLVQQGFDLSPILVFFLLHFLRRFLVPTLYEAAARLR
jgi:YggT family protein